MAYMFYCKLFMLAAAVNAAANYSWPWIKTAETMWDSGRLSQFVTEQFLRCVYVRNFIYNCHFAILFSAN